MSPLLRNVLIAVTLTGGSGVVYYGGQVVLAQTNKDAVFHPLGVRHGFERATILMNFTDAKVLLDGGTDDAGAHVDGEWTGLWTRTYGPDVRIEAEATLLPKIPFVAPEKVPLGYFSSADGGGVEAVEAVLRATVIPAMATSAGISMTDGGR
jgi:hypothetical protein